MAWVFPKITVNRNVFLIFIWESPFFIEHLNFWDSFGLPILFLEVLNILLLTKTNFQYSFAQQKEEYDRQEKHNIIKLALLPSVYIPNSVAR